DPRCESELVRKDKVHQHAGADERCVRPRGAPAHAVRPDRIPFGRHASSRATAAKKKRLPQSAARYLLAVSIMPSPTAAAADPAMLPMPPTATMTRTRTRYFTG